MLAPPSLRPGELGYSERGIGANSSLGGSSSGGRSSVGTNTTSGSNTNSSGVSSSGNNNTNSSGGGSSGGAGIATSMVHRCGVLRGIQPTQPRPPLSSADHDHSHFITAGTAAISAAARRFQRDGKGQAQGQGSGQGQTQSSGGASNGRSGSRQSGLMTPRRLLGVSAVFVGLSAQNNNHSNCNNHNHNNYNNISDHNHGHTSGTWQLTALRSYELEMRCSVDALPSTAAALRGGSGDGKGDGRGSVSNVSEVEAMPGKYEVTVVIAKLAGLTEHDEDDDEDDDDEEDSGSANGGNVVVYRDHPPAPSAVVSTATASSQYQRPGLGSGPGPGLGPGLAPGLGSGSGLGPGSGSGPAHTRVPSNNRRRQQLLINDDVNGDSDSAGKGKSSLYCDASSSVAVNGKTRFVVSTAAPSSSSSAASSSSTSASSHQQSGHSACTPSLQSFFITFLDEGFFSIQIFSRDISTSMSNQTMTTAVTSELTAWHLSSKVMVVISNS